MVSNDYPDGFRRNLPGHTVDLESGFSMPWAQSTSLVIAAGQSSSFTLNFSDSDFIYYVDMINLSPQAYKEFYMFVEVNGIVYMAGANMGFLTMPLRTNPSIFFLDGDSLKVTVYNLDSSQRTFVLHINGSKIIRPETFGHPPSAYYTTSISECDPYWSPLFTDGSSFSPTSWEWEWGDGSPNSVSQSTFHRFIIGGSFYPKLKASNQYGYDCYAVSSPIVVHPHLLLTSFVEVDPNGKITVQENYCELHAEATASASYVYRDQGSDYIKSIDVSMKISHSTHSVGSVSQNFALANDVGPLGIHTNGRLFIIIYTSPGPVHHLILGYKYNVTVWVEDYYIMPALSTYYVRLVKNYSESFAVLYVYSDSGFTSLVDTLIVSNPGLVNKSFRYIYVVSNDGAVSTVGNRLSTENIIVNSLS